LSENMRRRSLLLDVLEDWPIEVNNSNAFQNQ
jgi:hypothetical protein